jgi:hypothetical protein
MLLRNVGICLQGHKALTPRKTTWLIVYLEKNENGNNYEKEVSANRE